MLYCLVVYHYTVGLGMVTGRITPDRFCTYPTRQECTADITAGNHAQQYAARECERNRWRINYGQ